MDSKGQTQIVQPVPFKGEVVINPKTNRPIKVGGKAWLKLVKEGLLVGRYRDPNELGVIDNDETEENIDIKIKDINKTLPRGVKGVRGRGIHKGKIMKRLTPLSSDDITRLTAKVVNDNIELLSESLDVEADLERLILQETVRCSQAKPSKIVNKNPHTLKQKAEEKYVIDEPPEESFNLDSKHKGGSVSEDESLSGCESESYSSDDSFDYGF